MSVSDYSMHPLENITVSTSASESGLSHAVPRYSGEPDPFKHATDMSQCVTCGAQITVSRNIVGENVTFINLSRPGTERMGHNCATAAPITAK